MKIRRLGMAALAALAALAQAAGAAAQDPDPYDVVLHDGDVMVPMRDGVRLATDVLPPGPRPSPRRDPVTGPAAAHPLRQGGSRARGPRRLLRAARLRRRAAGHPGPLRVGGHVLEVPRLRRHGRLRHRRVDRRPALDGGRRRHVRHLVRGPHPGRRGQDEPAVPRGPAPQPGGYLRPLAPQGAQPRRVRAGAAARLGLRPAPPVARPGGAGRLRGRARGRLVRGDAPPPGPQPAGGGARVRGLRARPAHPAPTTTGRTPTSGTGRASA